MQFRLRYRAHDLELPLGEFVIGRSDECQLALDDPLVSRRHASLRVSARSVSIADLGSRNGVSVNGEKVQGERRLKHNDRVTIGGQEMVLSEVVAEDQGVQTRTMTQTLGDISLADVHRALGSVVAEEPTQNGTVPPIAPYVARASSPAPMMPVRPLDRSEPAKDAGKESKESKEPSHERAVTSHPKLSATFKLLAGMADKALGLGKPDEAERLLAPVLHEVMEAQRKKALDGPIADQAVSYALRIAGLSQKGVWVDYVFELHTASGKLISGPVVDELHVVIRKVKSVNLRLLRDYIAAMRARAPQFSPTERFAFQRLEGIEQVAALK